MSMPMMPSALVMYAPAVPNVYCGGSTKAFVLNHSSGVFGPALGSPTRFGRWLERPVLAMSRPEVTRIGGPDSSLVMPCSDHPPRNRFAAVFQFAPNFRPLPNGSSYT